MNKRDLVLSLLDPAHSRSYTPAAFFLHFDPACHRGQAAVDKHLEYFRFTGMDFVKIQYEHTFPVLDHIQRPADWVKMPLYQEDFFEPPLKVVEGIVKAAKAEALVIMTLYSPFMCAGHAVGAERMLQHIHEDPEAVKKGMQIVTESLMNFVTGCIRLGVDGFYTSTQGGETHRLADPALFNDLVRPYDLALMNEIDRACIFNILHICDYTGDYASLQLFLDYPGHVINCPLNVGGRPISGQEVTRLFGRPYMGGLDRKGILTSGNPAQVCAAAAAALESAPKRFILGADCTVLPGTPWENLRTAIETAHQYHVT
jgi:uroporphyrinogen decarboxylase